MHRNYVFIVGAPRSGTTWLQIMLAQHPSVATCQETHVFSGYLSFLHKSWKLHSADARRIGLQASISYEEFIRLQRQYALSVLNAIGDQPFILEKTPSHVKVWSDILEVIPEARFIHVVRDPRAVCASLLAASKDWGSSWAPKNCRSAAQRWADDVASGRAMSSSLGDACIEIKYEDLVYNACSVLRDIFCWLGHGLDETEVERIVANSNIEKLQKGIARVPWDFSKEPGAFYRKGQQDSWKDELSESQIAMIEHLASKHMEELGYEKLSRGLGFFGKMIIEIREHLKWQLNKFAANL